MIVWALPAGLAALATAVAAVVIGRLVAEAAALHQELARLQELRPVAAEVSAEARRLVTAARGLRRP